MNFFFDNNMPFKLARALAEVHAPEHKICHLRDKYRPDVDDVTWLTRLAREPDGPWLIVSGDLRISRNPVEQKAWLDFGHIIFFLADGWTTIMPNDQLWKFVKVFPKILEAAARARPGSGFIIPQSSLKLRPITLH